jgi:hypothetical protein
LLRQLRLSVAQPTIPGAASKLAAAPTKARLDNRCFGICADGCASTDVQKTIGL